MLLKQQVRWKQISVDFNFKKYKSRESNFDPSVPGRGGKEEDTGALDSIQNG
jgi:hypothetical protein